ncbi:ABC transporter permease [uncultured Clostridium sp.]|jgi:simple sugar transport system permease protein|uniref:ABC transporter permease n=1 Tax=uncultured Clostridium sp. TaxID=59620 RepID=UPI00261EEDA1|nr:ABC transporter permease [uncultured Clostridium sp.]
MNKKTFLSLLAMVLGLFAGGVLMLVMGYDPMEGYTFLFKGGTQSMERIGNTIATSVPLILTGLSVAFAFKTGLFNIGAPGQMLFGGFCALATGLTLELPQGAMIILMALAGIVGGALWAIVPGILKAKFNVHEVVATIMMNWIAYWIVFYAVPAYFKGEFMETESRALPEFATLHIKSLTEMFDGSFINLGIVIALIAVTIIAIILDKTVLGYELKAVGFNKDGAEYAGMPVNRNIILSMMIAGALAGLAGVVQYTGNSTAMQIGVMPTQGFDGIAVALLAANSPIGVVFSALFFGLLYTGRGFMSAMTGIPPEIADTIISIIIYFAATSVVISKLIDKIEKKRKLKKELSNSSSKGES